MNFEISYYCLWDLILNIILSDVTGNVSADYL